MTYFEDEESKLGDKFIMLIKWQFLERTNIVYIKSNEMTKTVGHKDSAHIRFRHLLYCACNCDKLQTKAQRMRL